MDQQKHEMILDKTHSSGAEEWYCPSCQRRLAITWHPWKKIVLEPGDNQAVHGGSKGGLQLNASQINPENKEDHPSATGSLDEDPYLDPWRRWLEKKDSDDFWNEEA
jgi:hypothetical protein